MTLGGLDVNNLTGAVLASPLRPPPMASPSSAAGAAGIGARPATSERATGGSQRVTIRSGRETAIGAGGGGDNEIPGLFAAGRCAVGVASNAYVSGLSIADALWSGRRAPFPHAAPPVPRLCLNSSSFVGFSCRQVIHELVRSRRDLGVTSAGDP